VLRKSINNEIQKSIHASEWADFRHAWNNTNKAVGLRMTYEDLQRIVTWPFDENIVDKPHILRDLWTLTTVYAMQ